MHVLFLHSYYCTSTSTSGSRSHDLCRALVACGHKVTVICQVVDLNRAMFSDHIGFIKRIEVDGIPIIGVDIPYSNKMGIAARLFSFFRFMVVAIFASLSVRGVDVVFATSTPPTIAVPALFCKYLKRVPFIFELRDIWPDFVEQLGVLPMVPRFVFRFIDFCITRVYHRADAVSTTTPGMTEIIADKGVARAKLGTILLGANLAIYEKRSIPHPVLSQSVLKDKFVVGFLGSISHGYGLQRLLDVAAQTRLVNPTIAFLILGRGGHFETLQKNISDMRLDNVYLGVSIPYHEVPGVLQHIQVGYESSLPSPASDCGLDNKFYDYISAGLPILSNYDGDMGKLLRKWRCGFVASDIAEEVSFLDRLEKNRESHTFMSGNALKLARELSRDKQKELFVSLLERHALAAEEV